MKKTQLQQLGVYYDRGSDMIRYNSERTAKLVNSMGIVVGTANNMTIDALAA